MATLAYLDCLIQTNSYIQKALNRCIITNRWLEPPDHFVDVLEITPCNMGSFDRIPCLVRSVVRL